MPPAAASASAAVVVLPTASPRGDGEFLMGLLAPWEGGVGGDGDRGGEVDEEEGAAGGRDEPPSCSWTMVRERLLPPLTPGVEEDDDDEEEAEGGSANRRGGGGYDDDDGARDGELRRPPGQRRGEGAIPEAADACSSCEAVTLASEAASLCLVPRDRLAPPQPGSETAPPSISLSAPPSCSVAVWVLSPLHPLPWPAFVGGLVARFKHRRRQESGSESGGTGSGGGSVRVHPTAGGVPVEASSVAEIRLPSGSAALWVVPSSLAAASPSGLARILMMVTTAPPPLRKLGEDDDDGEAPFSPPAAAAPRSEPSPASRLPPPLPPDPRVLFPRLTLRLLHQHEPQQQRERERGEKGAAGPGASSRWEPFAANDPRGQAFRTELFEGRLLVVLRPDPPDLDPHWNAKMFSARKRRILVQVQGRFRRRPEGTVYAGAEVSDPMRVGLLARGLSNVLLRIVEGFNPGVHSSFGTSQADGGGGEEEKAHIVVPAYSFFERVVATPPGLDPPELGSELEEAKESLDRRRDPAAAMAHRFNAEDTYTFSFHSMYVDLPRWRLVNLPLPRGDVSLRTFWHDSHLRICMYEKVEAAGAAPAAGASGPSSSPASSSSSRRPPHLHKDNRYAFVLQIRHREGDDEASQSAPERQETEALFRMSGTRYVAGGGEEASEAAAAAADGASSVTARESSGADAWRRSDSQLFLSQDETAASDAGSARNGKEENDEDEDAFVDALMDHGDDELLEEPGPEDRAPMAPLAAPFLHSSLELLSRIDAHCPFFLDAVKSRGGYARVYLVQAGGARTFRTLRECEELAEASQGKAQRIVGDAFSPRLSGSERLRRLVGCILASPAACLPASSADGRSKLESFVSARSNSNNNSLESLFLRRPEPVLSDRERAGLRWSGYAARAASDRHWIEEYVALSHRSVSFSHPDKRRASARVAIRSIEGVSGLPPDSCPPGLADAYSFLEIETLGRSVYLLFGSARDRDGFATEVQALRASARDEEADSSLASNPMAMDVENPADEFMHKSTMWNLKNRRLLNGGKYYFAASRSTNALEIVEAALRRASDVANEAPGYDEFELRHAFLVSAARLKQAHVVGLPEEWRLAFFLNLYHLMVLHAFVVLGPPDSSLQWIAYFNNASYETGDDVFSLAELEHCVVRSSMSAPSQFLSRFVIPKTRYRDDLALSRLSDFRINFALNCGSRSNPGAVPCYQVSSLRAQLDAAARLYLEGATATVRGSQPPGSSGTGGGETLVVCLPRLCQWFLSDFGDSPEHLLARVEPYLRGAARRALGRFRTPAGRPDASRIAVRYDAYSFECRPFVVLADPAPARE